MALKESYFSSLFLVPFFIFNRTIWHEILKPLRKICIANENTDVKWRIIFMVPLTYDSKIKENKR